MRAVHRSGQTFISWTEKEHLIGESYKLHRASFPFNDVRKPGVVDLGFQTWEQSGELFSDRLVDLESCEHGLIRGPTGTPSPRSTSSASSIRS